MLYIGVDLGTSAVKLLLMEESGKICNIVSKEYPLFFPHPGWSEQNPEDWFTESMEGIKELTEGIDRREVAGIGFGGQMHGLVTLDKDDNVIRPAILWNDGRTGEETEYLPLYPPFVSPNPPSGASAACLLRIFLRISTLSVSSSPSLEITRPLGVSCPIRA